MASAALWLVVLVLHHHQLLADGGSAATAAAAVLTATIAPTIVERDLHPQVGDAVPAAPTALLVEYRSSPVFGVDSPQPRFSWTLSSAERGVSASAYQIVVSVATQTAWDSGQSKPP